MLYVFQKRFCCFHLRSFHHRIATSLHSIMNKKRRRPKRNTSKEKKETVTTPYKRPIPEFLQEGRYRPSLDKIPPKPKPFGAPKRPTTAYFLYAADKRSEVREQNPDLTMTDIAKIIGANWNECSNEDKKHYEGEAKELKDKYQVEQQQWKKSLKYKRYKQDLADWNDLYYDEHIIRKEEKEAKREAKKEGKEKKKMKKSKMVAKKSGKKRT
eukprot:147667_1